MDGWGFGSVGVWGKRSALPAHPLANVPGESVQVVELLEMGVYLVPVYAEILVGEHVPESGQRRQSLGKLGGENAKIALLQDCLVVILWLWTTFERDDAVADVDAALGSHFKITLCDVPQVGIFLEITPRLLLEGP